jgi:tetratricopeptide (TPR) repeat protein
VALRKDVEREASLGMPAMPRVSLCMIVRDEQEHLARCLWSALPVADEIVVVDTGSADRTIDVAAAFGCRTLQRGWEGNFAAARNAGLAAARGAWILVLDADESLALQDLVQLRDLVAGNGATRQAYSLLTRNYVPTADVVGWHRNDGSYDEEAGSGWIPSMKVRLFPRDARIRFEGAVHELVEQSLGRAGYRIQDAPVVVHHYGKLDRHRTRRKGMAYRDLGTAQVGAFEDDSPERIRTLAVQEEELGNFSEALIHWRRYSELAPQDPRGFLGIGTSAIGAGEVARAVDALERARRLLPDRPEPGVQLAIALMHVGRPHDALAIVREGVCQYPDYHHGRAVLALALLASGLEKEGLDLVRELQAKGVSLTAFFTGHARRFLDFGPRALAVAVLQPLADAGMITAEQGAILVQAYRDQATLP